MGTGLTDRFFGGCNACTVDETKQGPHGFCRCHGGLRVGFLAYVAPYKLAADGLGHRLAFFSLHISNQDVSAVLSEHARRALSQPGCAASDDEDG